MPGLAAGRLLHRVCAQVLFGCGNQVEERLLTPARSGPYHSMAARVTCLFPCSAIQAFTRQHDTQRSLDAMPGIDVMHRRADFHTKHSLTPARKGTRDCLWMTGEPQSKSWKGRLHIEGSIEGRLTWPLVGTAERRDTPAKLLLISAAAIASTLYYKVSGVGVRTSS